MQKIRVKSFSRLFVLALLLTVPTPAQQLKLEEGKSITGEIRSGAKETYSLDIPSGKTVGVQVNQKGVDLIVRAFAPDGTKLAGVDAPIGAYGAETLWFITTAAGKYKIELEPYEGGGSYEVLLLFIRPTLPQDKQITQAQLKLQDSYNDLAEAIERVNRIGVIEPSSASAKPKSSTPKSSSKSGPAKALGISEGATAECQDGTFSYSQSRRGTCSHHGGVKRWLR